MNLNDLLLGQGIRPEGVLVFRHRPCEPQLNKVLPWLVAERHDLFNAYQQTQPPRLQSSMEKMKGRGYVASFLGLGPGRAVFAGLYHIAASRPLTYEQYWQNSAYNELKEYGHTGWEAVRKEHRVLWFDLELVKDFYPQWKGRLTIAWPPPERSWWRRAHRNDMKVLAIPEKSALTPPMPRWDEISVSLQELKVWPAPWKETLRQWRGVYYLFDISDGKAYVGSAYGADNILGRWLQYASSGHGGNKLLRKRDPDNFRFSILHRVSPDLDATSVIQLENSWKCRLHTRQPEGLNDN